MKCDLRFGDAYCYLSGDSAINGVHASEDDFGSHSDVGTDEAEPYCCSNMEFQAVPATQSVLDKYKISVTEYNEVCEKMDKGLSFGGCCWCS